MGQYLSIGFVRRMSASEQSVQQGKLSQDEVVAEMQSSHGFAPELYNFAIEDKHWTWTLKPEVWSVQLVPLLEVLYPVLYGQDDEDWEKALTALRETPAENWDEMLDGNGFSAELHEAHDLREMVWLGLLALLGEVKM